MPPYGVAEPEWEGSYSSCDGQRVTRDDAISIASALERVLADPARESRQREVLRKLNEHVRELMMQIVGPELVGDQQAIAADEDQEIATNEDLRTLIAFLREGGFRID